MTTTDLTRFTPGEVLAIDDKWGDLTFAKAVVFCGIDRGLAVIAEADVNAPFNTDPLDGSRPHLRRATWKPRRVRASTIRGTWAEEEAQRAAERRAEIERRAAQDAYEDAKEQALRYLSEALDRFPGVTSYTYRGGEIRVYGDPAAIEAVAGAIAALDVSEVTA